MSKKHLPCIIFASFTALLGLIIHGDGMQEDVIKDVIKAACSTVIYPDACIYSLSSSSLSSSSSSSDIAPTPQQLSITGAKSALKDSIDALDVAKNLSTKHGYGLENAAVLDCVELLGDARHQLSQTVYQISHLQPYASPDDQLQQLENAKIWISAALTGFTTCGDGFRNLSGSITDQMLSKQSEVSKVITNALYLVTQQMNSSSISSPPPSPSQIHSRGLLNCFPHWLSPSDRTLLQAPLSSMSFNAIVAKDGSGQYRKIKDAIANITSGYAGRYLIYIKAGIYKETVDIPIILPNITFLGDGINKTIITENKNVSSNRYTTFRTATVGISGQGFIARGITFRNTAGPAGYQAVAMRVGADYVAFDSCSFEGYQDTLYALSSRQFYKGCTIYGTVDFIFGNAAAVFQNCMILARRPLLGQQNTITAQGRLVAVDPTGFSFQNCSLIAADDLNASNYSVSTFLGRPWKAYSRTVFLESYYGSLIQPAGWLPWNASNPFEDTVYYGEYKNYGPGSGIQNRVQWLGVHPNLSHDNATIFSVANFISGDTWLPQDNIDFIENIYR